MLSASEANTIAKEVNRAEYELKEIEPYIKAIAMEGGYKVILHRCMPLHPKTIEELRRLGYKVTVGLDERNHHFERIEWGDEEE